MFRATLHRVLRFSQVFFIALSFFLTVLPSPAQAQVANWTGPCVGSVSYDGATFEAASIEGIECLVANVLATATTFIGLASFVMVIVGAFYYLTSGGSSQGVELGKKSITYGLIGIIVALMAYFILFLLADFTGVDRILKFNLKVGG